MSTHTSQEFETPQGTLPDGTPEPAQHPLVRFSVKNYVFSIGVFVMAVLFGLVCTFRLGVELLPNFEIPVLAISTSYPGANPDQVDREVSQKIEDAVSTLSGVVDINTTSVSNQSAVVVSFADKTNVDSAANSVSQAVAAIRGTLPSGAEAPVVQKFDPNAQPILTLALLGGAAPERDVTTYAEDVLKPRLQRVAGVADISITSGPKREVQVLLDPARLQTYDLSPGQVTQAISASALDLPAGSVTQGGQITSYATRNTPRSAADVGKVVLNPSTGLQVQDVATVRDSSAEAASYARVNGQSAVLLAVRKASGTNSVAVTDRVREAMRAEKLPAGYQLKMASDTTLETRATVKDTFGEFLIAIAAVGLICLLFLGRLNTVLAVIIAIPISISAAPLLFSTLGFTFNIISLLAIIVAIGIVVDDSIVVAENVQRYRDMGYSPIRSVLLGGSEVFSAVTAASFSLLSVLIPLSFMPGIIGQFFSQFGLGIAAAIVMSWLESLLFLTVRMAYTKEPARVTWREVPAALRQSPRFLTVIYIVLEGLINVLHSPTIGLTNRIAREYARTLDKALRRPGLIVLLAGLFLLSVPLAMKGLGFAFTPKTDSGLISVNVKLPPGSSLAATNHLTSQLEDILFKNPAVKLVQSGVGTGDVMTANSSNVATLEVTLTPKGTRPATDTVAAGLQKQFENAAVSVPGTRITAASVQGGPGGSADIALALTAPNQAVLAQANSALVGLLAKDGNLKDVTSSLSETRQERTFVTDPSRLTGTGLTPSDVAQALRTYNNGSKAGTMRAGDKSIDIVVKLDPALVSDSQSLLTQTVYSPALQANVPLSQLGRFQASQAPATLSRYNKAYTSSIDINLIPGGPNAFDYQKTLIDRAEKAGILKNGVTLGNGSAFGSSGLTSDLVFYGPILMVVAMLLTYLVLGSQFNSFRYPLYLLLPVPLAIVGALWTLKLFGVNLDVITVLGMVILLGLSTKNSILYLEFVTERARTLPLREALLEAAELRFRPIIMTTLTVLVISIPLVLGKGEGAEFRRGLGIVILGGVLTSTLLTFFVVPSVFWLGERRRQGGQSSGPSPELPRAEPLPPAGQLAQ